MGCPESVKIGQRWRYHRAVIEATVDHPQQLHGKVVATLNGHEYKIGVKDYWVSDVRVAYGQNWEYLEGQDAPTS